MHFRNKIALPCLTQRSATKSCVVEFYSRWQIYAARHLFWQFSFSISLKQSSSIAKLAIPECCWQAKWPLSCGINLIHTNQTYLWNAYSYIPFHSDKETLRERECKKQTKKAGLRMKTIRDEWNWWSATEHYFLEMSVREFHWLRKYRGS